ncbi:beta-propeller fold lactonase family protein [Acidobacterium sp. S8]|uniref:lactonase family protein n=1 Tax=Acidobacterium sp. S8 TaxID=1641854 RepID=UPI00131D66EE|nr:beta-propeller fold lactonase family protein [Acidobacterium sp. S8]
MRWNTRWSRRTFLQGIGYSSVLGALDNILPHSKTLLHAQTNAISPDQFAYIASKGIDVFELSADHWTWKQNVPSRSPVSLTLHPSQQFLYAANEVDEYEGLPRGTVEAYRINPKSGFLTLINRQPLSLSGTRPRHIAVSHDGKHLVVAIHGGGAYNILPIEQDGTLGRVTQILKEVGTGSHPIYQASAHPHTVVFDPAGRHLLATDEGRGRISVFAFQNGRMVRTFDTVSQPASRPGHLAMHPAGNFFYVSNLLDGSIDCYRYSPNLEEIEHEQRVMTTQRITAREAQSLVISASGRFLYTSSSDQGLSVWKIDSATGKLSIVQRSILKDRSWTSLTLSSDDRRLFVLDNYQNELSSLAVHPESGELGTVFTVARTTMPRSLVFKQI